MSDKGAGKRVLAPIVGAGVLATVLSAAPAFAAEADFTYELPAGLACAFPLKIEGTGDNRIMKEFTDRDGNVVRMLSAGRGFELTFTNLTSGRSVTVPSNGSVQQTTIEADGSLTVQDTGHNVVVLFPTDVPAGPSTTLYTGRLVYTVDLAGVFTVQSISGRTSDICARLA